MTGRDDWLEWRRGGVGASDIAALMGISPWASPWSVWADKMGWLPPQDEDEYMTAGRWLEAAIGPWFEHETGLVVAGEQAECTDNHYYWMRATVDGLVFESDPCTHGGDCEVPGHPNTIHEGITTGYSLEHALGTFEVKVTGSGKRWDPVPPYYQAQGQWQMAVTGLERTWFAVLMGRRLDIHELKRDDADIEFMTERAERFWVDHVLAGVPPATDASDATARALAAVYPEPVEGESVELNAGFVQAWVEAKVRLMDAQLQERAAANRIKAQLMDAEEGTVDGRRVVSWRLQERSEYTVKANSYRVLRHHKPKEK